MKNLFLFLFAGIMISAILAACATTKPAQANEAKTIEVIGVNEKAPSILFPEDIQNLSDEQIKMLQVYNDVDITLSYEDPKISLNVKNGVLERAKKNGATIKQIKAMTKGSILKISRDDEGIGFFVSFDAEDKDLGLWFYFENDGCIVEKGPVERSGIEYSLTVSSIDQRCKLRFYDKTTKETKNNIKIAKGDPVKN